MITPRLVRFAFVAAFLPLLAQPPASVPNRPFTLIGFIEEFKLNGVTAGVPADLQPATLRVNGIDVTIPQNLIIQMPGSYLTSADIFRGPRGLASPIGLSSGLALNDPTPPLAAYEASIIGNILPNGEYVAGMVGISQHSLASGDGVIESITTNTNPPEILVKSGKGTATVRLRLNDPRGRFSRPHSDDIRFRSDDQNPTIGSETGFPVCLADPTNATFCPDANRPHCSADPLSAAFCADAKNPDGSFKHLRRFVAGLRNVTEIDPKNTCRDCRIALCPTCDPRKPAPLRPGDYITFSGTLVQTKPERIISVHTLTAAIAIYTSPGASPAYVNIETSRYGTGGVPFPGINQEQGFGRKLPAPATTTNIKIEGMTTDPSRRVQVWAIDVNPTTGDDVRRSSGNPPQPLQALTPAAIPLGRWREVLTAANHLPPSRELRAVVEGEPFLGVPVTIRGVGFALGPYQAPVEEFIFPEGTTPGTGPVPMNFESLCFLRDGSGPLKTLDRPGSSSVVVGQLKPFPVSGSIPMVQTNVFGVPICATTVLP